MEEKKQSKIIFAVIGVAILLTLTVGLSFAIYSYSNTSSANTITTGTISMSFTENSNVVKIDQALPVTSNTSAKASTASGDYFDFSVQSISTAAMTVTYEIKATKITTVDTGYSLLPNSSVYLYLTKVESGTETALYDNTAAAAFGDSDNATLATVTHTHSAAETKVTSFRLRMFIPSTVDASSWGSTTKLEYKVRIDVNATA